MNWWSLFPSQHMCDVPMAQEPPIRREDGSIHRSIHPSVLKLPWLSRSCPGKAKLEKP